MSPGAGDKMGDSVGTLPASAGRSPAGHGSSRRSLLAAVRHDVVDRPSASSRSCRSGRISHLIDLEEDKAARAVVFGLLREMERRRSGSVGLARIGAGSNESSPQATAKGALVFLIRRR